ncbi:hypothetical protein ACEWY4_012172 [Coilia grayii]|uniref:Arrestin C-terminal-like domain-containing protein n=1 Tax=Coilia grayii TaxID=363190 RepID=A0ABD1JZR7_9TELE
MSQTIKKISVTYDAINPNNTFTCGDIIHGRVTVEIAKDTKIDSFRIKFKGKAQVRWTEHDHHHAHGQGHVHHGHEHGHHGHGHHNRRTVTYFDKEKYFKSEQFFIREVKGNDDICPVLKNEAGEPYCDIVAPGTHIYPFIFQVPQQNLPPSFQGAVGFIAYTLEAKLSRSMRLSSKAKAEIHYVPKPDLTVPDLMVPQHGSKDKRMKVFTSGNISFSIHTERMGYYLGEPIKIVAEVQNSSSRELKLKYCLYGKHSFFAQHKRKLHTQDILKEEGESIAKSTRQTVTKVITISPHLTTSILNCRIIKVEYRLKVYLDVPYASDPEIKFPIVILPVTSASGGEKAAPPAMSSIGFGGGWNPDQPPWNSGPYTLPQQAWNSMPPNTMPQPAWNSMPPNTTPQPAWNSAPYTTPQPAWNSAPPTAPSAAWNSTAPTAPPPAYDSYAFYPPLPNSSETEKSDLL